MARRGGHLRTAQAGAHPLNDAQSVRPISQPVIIRRRNRQHEVVELHCVIGRDRGQD